MFPFAIGYAGAAVTMLVLDAIWLTLAVPRIYQPALGDLLSPKPNFAVAGVFYLIYVIGIVVFAVLPAVEARSWLVAVGLGALLGLVAYGTYDFTNLATVRGWPVGLSLLDVTWGIVLTAAAAWVGHIAVTALAPPA